MAQVYIDDYDRQIITDPESMLVLQFKGMTFTFRSYETLRKWISREIKDGGVLHVATSS